MKLATKGLLLVAVPVVSQMAMILTMSILLWRAHSLALEEANAKEAISACTLLLNNVGGVVKKFYGVEGDDQTLNDADISLIQQNVDALKAKLSTQKQESEQFKRLSKQCSAIVPLLQAVREHRFEQHGTKYRSERILFAELDRMHVYMDEIVQLINNIHRLDPERRAAAAESIKVTLGIFIVISIAVTLGLAYFASVSIRKPLELMSQNAENIARRVSLFEPLSGQDELADLDRLLHQVNDSINEALTSERNLIAYAGDLVCSIDKDGIFRSANPYSTTLLSCSPERLIGSSALDFVISDDCDKVDRLLVERNQPEKSGAPLEVRMQSSAGAVVDTSWSAIWSEQDKSFFCVIHDISERKNLERMKQDFIAMISHDLRTPLMSVHSAFDLVQSGATGELAEHENRQIEGANRSTEHLIELVNDLLDFEKLEAGRMDFFQETFSLHDALQECLLLVKALSERTNVQIHVPTGTMQVRTDRRKLVQVLVNLLSNALKHSPPHGAIRIEAASKNDGYTEISVHDQGPGVPEEFRASIFAPFEQITHRATAKLGTGLGLAICKLIVEGQGGKIGVRASELLSGSAFWLTVES